MHRAIEQRDDAEREEQRTRDRLVRLHDLSGKRHRRLGAREREHQKDRRAAEQVRRRNCRRRDVVPPGASPRTTNATSGASENRDDLHEGGALCDAAHVDRGKAAEDHGQQQRAPDRIRDGRHVDRHRGRECGGDAPAGQRVAQPDHHAPEKAGERPEGRVDVGDAAAGVSHAAAGRGVRQHHEQNRHRAEDIRERGARADQASHRRGQHEIPAPTTVLKRPALSALGSSERRSVGAA